MKRFNLNKSNSAFTMSEVLLAMTIIGIIAVITIPTLTGRTSSKQFATTYKKGLAAVEQALKMASTEGKDASAEPTKDGTEVIAFAAGQALIDNIGAVQVGTTWILKAASNSVWGNNTPVAGTTEPASAVTLKDSGSANNAQVFMLKDKLTYLILPGKNDGRCYSAGKPVIQSDNSINYNGAYCMAYIDVNGNKGPNQVISCDNQEDVMGANTDYAKFKLNIEPQNCVLTHESITDVYPVIIYDDKIIPATPAAAAVLQDRY